MTCTNNDSEVPLISFIPEEHKPDKERISSFKVYSTPGDSDTTRYDFTIFHIDGNKILLNFKRQVQKLKVATAATKEDQAPAFKNVVWAGKRVHCSSRSVPARVAPPTRQPIDIGATAPSLLYSFKKVCPGVPTGSAPLTSHFFMCLVHY